MRSDIDANVVTEYQSQDMAPCARVIVENDLMPFSLYAGGASDAGNYWAHDAKTFTKAGTTYVLRARADGSTLYYQVLDDTEVLTAANWTSWTSTGIIDAGILGPDDAGVAIAVDNTGKAQIFHFDDSGDLNVTECADVLAGSPSWGAATQIRAAINSSARMVAACRLDECFFSHRNAVCSAGESLYRGYNSGGWSYKLWPLQTYEYFGEITRGATWGNSVWGGIACCELDGKVLVALGSLTVGSTDVPYDTGVFLFYFQDGASWSDEGVWWAAGRVSPAQYTMNSTQYFADCHVRLNTIDDKAWLTFRREDEPCDIAQTESTQAVPRFRFIAHSRSGDGYHWSEMRYVTDNYEVSGTGPILLVGEYLYMPCYQSVYYAPATSKVGVTNSSVRYTLNECTKAEIQCSSRRTPGRATLTVAEASDLNASTIVKPLSRVFIDLGAEVSGTPTYEQIWQGRLASPDSHQASEEPPFDERMIACYDDLAQLSFTKAMENIDFLRQERIYHTLSDFSYLAKQAGTWETGTTASWGTTICCRQVLRTSLFTSYQGYGLCYLTQAPCQNAELSVDFCVHKYGSADHGAGSDAVKAGIAFRGRDRRTFMAFYYDNATDTLRLGTMYAGSATWVLDSNETGTLSWQNNSKRSLRVLIHRGRAVCQYKNEADTTWTEAFTYDFDESATCQAAFGQPSRIGLFAHAEDESGDDQACVFFHNMEFAGEDFDRTVEELAKYCFAMGDVHDFTRLRSTLYDTFGAALSTDDWATATADGTWTVSGGQLPGVSGASAWAELLTTHTMINPVLEWDMTLGASERGGVIIRATDEENYLSVTVTQGAQGSARATLAEMVSDSLTRLDDCIIACEIPAGEELEYTLFANNEWITLWLGRQLLAAFYDATPTYTSGYVGLCCYNCTVEFDNFRIPEMMEVPDSMTFDAGKDMMSTLNGMIGQRHVRFFMDNEGIPVMGHFVSRDGISGTTVTFEDGCFVSVRQRQKALTHCRLHGAEGWAEYWREGQLDNGEWLYEDLHSPDIFMHSAMYNECRYHIRESLEMSEQADVDVRADLRVEPEDVITITVSQQGIDDQYVVDDISQVIELGQQVTLACQIGTRRYTTL